MPTDDDRDAILARRRRWIALALAGAATTSLAACRPCLTPTYDANLHDAGPDSPPSEDASNDANDVD